MVVPDDCMPKLGEFYSQMGRSFIRLLVWFTNRSMRSTNIQQGEFNDINEQVQGADKTISFNTNLFPDSFLHF